MSPVRTPARRTLALAVLTLIPLGTATACGDDPISRDEFIKELSSVTSGPDRATTEVAGCIYDAIAGDNKLLVAASKSTDISKSNSDKLAAITKRCALKSRSTTTTK